MRLQTLLVFVMTNLPIGSGVHAAGDACQGVRAQGCCHQEQLLYCETGTLKQEDCGTRPRCGWRETGRYDCDTSGSADPEGGFSKRCPKEVLAALGPLALGPLALGPLAPGPLAPDPAARGSLPLGPKGRACGAVREEGCCHGNELRLCIDGQLRKIDCDFNRFCGWRGVAQAYNCGTEGQAAPGGGFPRNCPRAPDSGPLIFPDAAALSGAAGTPRSGCGCSLGAKPLPWGGLALLLLLVLRRPRAAG